MTDKWSMLWRPMAIGQVNVAKDRLAKPKLIWIVTHSDRIYEQGFVGYGEILATWFATGADLECRVSVPPGTIAKAMTDTRKRQAITQYLSNGLASDCRHYFRHWWRESELMYNYVVTLPQFYSSKVK